MEGLGADGAWGLQARLLESVDEAIIVTTPEGVVICWNRAAERLYGWERAEVLGRDVVAILVPEDVSGYAPRIMGTVAAGGTWVGDSRVRRCDGTSLTASVTNTPMPGEDGQLLGVTGSRST